MRFILAFQPGPGHWSRMGAIALALRRRGHHVTAASSESFRRQVGASCDDFLPIGPNWEEDKIQTQPVMGPPSISQELCARSSAIASYFFGGASSIYSDLSAALRRGRKPDMAVFDYTLLGGAPAAEAMNLRWATVFGLTVPFHNDGWPPFGSHLPYTRSLKIRERYAGIERQIAHENRELYRPVRELWRKARRRARDPWQAYAQLGCLGIVGSISECDFPLPERFPRHIRYVGPLVGRGDSSVSLDREAAAFVHDADGNPLVHLTLGLTFSRAENILFPILEALSTERLRLIVASGLLNPRAVKTAVGPSAARVLVRRTLPHHEIIPELKLLICHGGANTLMKALHFGIPALVIPLGAEQRSNGARLVHAGIGRMILPNRLTAASVRHEVRTLLDPKRGYFDRAGKLGEKAREPGGADLAAQLLEKACSVKRGP